MIFFQEWLAEEEERQREIAAEMQEMSTSSSSLHVDTRTTHRHSGEYSDDRTTNAIA